MVLLLCTGLLCVLVSSSKDAPKKKKDIRDYNDADMARLLEQWEVRVSFRSVRHHTVAASLAAS